MPPAAAPPPRAFRPCGRSQGEDYILLLLLHEPAVHHFEWPLLLNRTSAFYSFLGDITSFRGLVQLEQNGGQIQPLYFCHARALLLSLAFPPVGLRPWSVSRIQVTFGAAVVETVVKCACVCSSTPLYCPRLQRTSDEHVLFVEREGPVPLLYKTVARTRSRRPLFCRYDNAYIVRVCVKRRGELRSSNVGPAPLCPTLYSSGAIFPMRLGGSSPSTNHQYTFVSF